MTTLHKSYRQLKAKRKYTQNIIPIKKRKFFPQALSFPYINMIISYLTTSDTVSFISIKDIWNIRDKLNVAFTQPFIPFERANTAFAHPRNLHPFKLCLQSDTTCLVLHPAIASHLQSLTIRLDENSHFVQAYNEQIIDDISIDLKGLEVCTNLTSLCIEDYDVHDISFILNMPKLQSFSIAGGDGAIRNIDIFTRCCNLQHLELYRYNNNIQCIPKCTSLRTLKIQDCESINTITNISELQQLEILILYEISGLHSLNGLQYCTSLTDIQLSHSSMTDLFPLSGCINIRNLSLSYFNELVSLEFMTTLTRIQSVVIYDCVNLTSLEGMNKCIQLTTLSVIHTQVTDFTAISECKVLQKFILENANFAWDHGYSRAALYLDTFNYMPALHTVHISTHNTINDKYLFQGCSALTHFKLTTNTYSIDKIAVLNRLTDLELNFDIKTDVNILSICSNLVTLTLDMPKIATISFAQELPKLRTFNVSSNYPAVLIGILSTDKKQNTLNKDYSMLRMCSNIEQLDLKKLNIDSLIYLSGYTQLRKLSLYKCNIANLCVGDILPNMKELCLIETPDLISLEGINSFPALANITIDDAVKLISVDGIQNCEYLECFCLSKCGGITEIPSLANKIYLRKVWLFDVLNVSKLLNVDGCINLETITIRGDLSMVDWSGITNCIKLKEVDLDDHYRVIIENKEIIPKMEGFLNGCPNVEKLSINIFLKTLEYDMVQQCSNLRELTITSAVIFNGINLDICHWLTKIHISCICNITDFKFVQKCPYLRSIVLNEASQLTSLQGLENHKYLEILELIRVTHLTNISALKTCPKLRILILNHSIITSVKDIRFCTKLRVLSLNYSNINSLKGMEGLLNLEVLSLVGTTISSIGEIKHCPILHTVNFTDNKMLEKKGFTIREMYPNIKFLFDENRGNDSENEDEEDTDNQTDQQENSESEKKQ